jgi:SAM-dependent methyltransferase
MHWLCERSILRRDRRRTLPSATYDAVWGRVFATVYDAAFALAERRGFRDIRRDLVGRATGRVLELGAGTGLNIAHYSKQVSELVLTEPDWHMAAKLRKRVERGLPVASVLEAAAESIPVDDASFDTVVSTLVLCTVRDPIRVLAEVDRILRPGGAFLFAEHVRSASPRAARWQDRLNRSWSWYACGCQCNRDTALTIEGSSLRTEEIREDRLRWISPVVRPLIVGTATSGV